MGRKIIAGGLVIGVLNLLFYLVVSPRLFGESTAFALGGPLATTLAWTENFIFGRNRIFPGIPPVIWSLLPGIVIGALASGILSGHSDWTSFWRTKLETRQIIRTSAGGLLVGFGVLLGNGCLVKHALSGLPGFSFESIVTLAGIGVGIWCTIKIEEKRLSK